jgi:hypothetical protein
MLLVCPGGRLDALWATVRTDQQHYDWGSILVSFSTVLGGLRVALASLLKSISVTLHYSKAYKNAMWFSELSGDHPIRQNIVEV